MTKNVWILAVILLTSFVECERKTLKLGEKLASNLNGKDNDRYSISISSIQPNGYLFIRAEGSSPDTLNSPTLRITKDSFSFDCWQATGISLCVIDEKLIKENEQIKVDVNCLGQCTYEIKAYQSRDYIMEVDESVNMAFQNDNSIFEAKITVPDQLNFTEIKILTFLKNAEEVNGTLNVFVNVGDNVARPTSSSYGFKGQSIWNDGLGVFLDSSEIKPKQNIQILITGSKGMEIMITCFSVRNNERDISIGEKLYDDVRKNTTKMYLLDLAGMSGLENADIYMKLTQFTGRCRILVSPDLNFSPKSIITGEATISVTQVSVTPQIRLSLGFQNKFYIAVSGDYDSAYMLQVTIESQNFTLLDNEVAQLSAITGKEVDNYLYVFAQTLSNNSQENYRQFMISAEFFTQQSLYFSVRRCRSFEANASTDCLIKDVDHLTEQQQSFKEIIGEKHESNSLNSFIFRYDIRRCTQQSEIVFRCALQVVAFSMSNNPNPTSYILKLEESGSELSLQQSVPRRSRISQSHSDRYYFSLPTTDDVESVVFYLTIISGDCLLMASSVTRSIEIGAPNVQMERSGTIKYTGNISSRYYLKVQAYTVSYYTLTAVVNRKQSDSNESLETLPLHLTEGIAQLFSTEGPTDMQFYINFNSKKSFYVQTSTSKGIISFDVRPSEKYKILPKVVWNSDGGQAHISNSNDSYSDSNDFIVTVHSTVPSQFEIVYNKEGECGIFRLTQAVVADVDESDFRCFGFHLNRARDVEIVVASSYFEMTTGNVAVTLTVGENSPRQLSQKMTVINADEIQVGCPDLKFIRGNVSDCLLTVNITAVKSEEISIAVQYVEDELELFDGIGQSVQGQLSLYKGRYFYYQIDKIKPVLISIKSATPTKYRILARIADWASFFKTSSLAIFPVFHQQQLPHADTTEFGLTALLLKSNYLLNEVKSNSIVLISVFANSEADDQANFNIEVIQSVAKLRPSEIKQGFVEMQQRKQYRIQTDGTKQLIVHLNSYQVACGRMELFRIGEKDSRQQKTLMSTMSGQLLITPAQEPAKYIVEVTGVIPCGYEISYSQVNERIYEILHGLHFNVEFKINDEAYFLYLNTRPESFRVVSMVEYGKVLIKAKSLKEIKNLSEVIAKGRYEFAAESQGRNLLVSNQSRYFCTNCYYLIQVSSTEPAVTSILVHNLNSPVSIRQNRLIRQTLDNNLQQENYALLRLVPFRITFGVLYGTPTLTITNTKDEKYSVVHTINQTTTINVQYNQSPTSAEDQYDNAAFLLNIKCQNNCSFTMVVDIQKYARRMVEGLPYNLMISPTKQGSCVQFLSLEKDTSTYMHITSNNATNIRFEVKCYNKQNFTECLLPQDQKYIKDIDRTNDNINVQLKSIRGYYHFCMYVFDPNIPINATLVHSQNIGMRFVSESSVNLMNSNHDDPPTMFEMYNPNKNSVMVEVFECIGEVSFEATLDYRKFVDNVTSIAEHSKTAGHYVIRLDPTEKDSNVFFARIKAKNTSSTPDATYIFTYNFFEQDKYPFSIIGQDNTDIRYDFGKKSVTFTVKAIEHGNQVKIISSKYKIFIAKQSKAIKAAVQCGTINVFSREIVVGPNDAASTEYISFEVSKNDIKSAVGKESTYFYVTVSCQVEVVDSEKQTSTSKSYRFIYDTMELSGRNPAKGLGTFKINAKFLLTWVIAPILVGLIVFCLAFRYCFRQVKGVPHSELVEDDPFEGAGQIQVNYEVGKTQKNLIGNTQGENRDRMQEY